MKHGWSAYRNGVCKCGICRKGHADAQNKNTAKWRASRVEIDGRLVAPLPPERHGSWSTYANYGCQCDPCREAARPVNKRSYERWKARQADRAGGAS
jgi:hypothetical protein